MRVLFGEERSPCILNRDCVSIRTRAWNSESCRGAVSVVNGVLASTRSGVWMDILTYVGRVTARNA